LLHKLSAIRANIPTLCSTMFKFTLKYEVRQNNKRIWCTMTSPTRSVEYESVVPY
jgi:hypothetical protein